MSDQSDNLVNLIKPFGLSTEEANIYLHLLRNGILTALKISRELGMARTKVYRILDRLIETGLVTKKLGNRGLEFISQSYRQFDLLLAQKESELLTLKLSTPNIYQALANLGSGVEKSAEVLYFQGIEGLKQVTWNSLNAKDELLIFEILDMSAFLDFGFCEKVRQEFVRRKVKVRELSNQKHMPPWTKVNEFVEKFWQCRYIDPKLLKMNFEMLIYNDVYAIYNVSDTIEASKAPKYNFKEGQIFCVEVHNQDLANMQRQIFNFMWQKAQRMKVINDQGEARLTGE